jgi:hypothetical protein
MPFAAALVMLIVSTALQVMLAPKPKTEKPTPGKLETPSAEEGGPIPVVFGTEVIKEPMIIFTGNASTTPIVVEGGGKK